MILVAYLNLPDVRNRDLRKSDRHAGSMIGRSDDHATDKVFSHVGYSGLQNLASRVGMKNFSTGSHWGRSNIDAEDQSLFLLHIDDFIPKRHRAAAMHLLASVIAEQRWGHRPGRPMDGTSTSRADGVRGRGGSTARLRF